MNHCMRCKEERDPSHFHTSRGKLSTWCKTCYKEYAHKRYSTSEKARERILKNNKEWRLKNKDRVKNYKSNHNKANSEQKRIWRTAYYSTVHGRFIQYRNTAKYRSIPFEITEEQFATFWQKLCYYCGSDVKTVGLDRIDNSKGYVEDNIVSCCETCNSMKLHSSQQAFYDQIAKIFKYKGLAYAPNATTRSSI